MKVLLTGAASDLGRAVSAELQRQRHRLRLTDRRRLRTAHEFVQSRLGHGRHTDDLVAGMRAVVHIPGPPAAAAAAAWIDACTRCTYNLLTAATAAGVRHCVYLGSLDGFTAYDDDLRVTPDWRPRPATEPGVMAPYLGEFVAREFAQTGQLQVTVLRLGHLIDADRVRDGDDLDPLALDPRDAAGAVAAALRQGRGRQPAYRVAHVQGDFEGARFRSRLTRRRRGTSPGFELRYDFGRPRRDEEP